MACRGLVLATVCVGCGLFPNLGGLEGGDAQASDASSVDAPDVAEVSTKDASLDAGDWCASQMAGYWLCSDFDLSGGVTQGFDIGLMQIGTVGGTFNLDTTTFVSPPRSALGVANPFGAMQTSGDVISGDLWPLGTTPATMSCSLQWDPVALSTTANDYAHVVEISFWADMDESQGLITYSLNMQGNGELIMLEYSNNGSIDVSHPVTSTIDTGSWTPVTLALTTKTYSVTVGTASVMGNLSASLETPSHGTVEIGPAYYGGSTTTSSPGWTFGYDNVVCY